uniref:Uncharacterized protein n=1 Tax=virus sp. ct8MV80 TaxID=2826793 RepID=A0A8S5R7F4_9VIRU|nr:MAG TPA: hypothetical protein [virus sp. ct8MV80]
MITSKLIVCRRWKGLQMIKLLRESNYLGSLTKKK